MIRILLLAFFVLFSMPAKADDFAHIPVLHDGRIKPMDSFARIHLKLFSGSERIDGISAQDWLLETLFDPPKAFARPVFKVSDPDVRDILKLPDARGHLYSLAQLTPALEKSSGVIATLLEREDKDLSRSQRALLDLHVHRVLFSNILRSLSLVVPLSITPPESLNLPEQEYYTALDFERIAKKAEQKMQAIVKAKGNDIDSYSEEELSLAHFMMQMSVLQGATADNVLFRIIPAQWSGSAQWLSPWAMIQTGQGSPESAIYLENWKEAAIAYKEGDDQKLDDVFAVIYQQAAQQFPDSTSEIQLKAEVFYNGLHPFHWAMASFAIAVFACAAYAMRPIYLSYYASWCGVLAGCGFAAIGIFARMVILDRPPVGTLYESLLFVSMMVGLISIIAELRYKNALSLFGGALIGFILLAVSGPMAVNPDDKEVLVAVLDTNFWLATHVLIITGGYGLCLLTALAAHIQLGIKAFDIGGRDLQKNMTQAIYLGALLSLLFMSVGTILGGVWADQSWGRFWGWDPKENGALLIVLWLAWVLHGKISGHLKTVDTTALYAYLTVIVALSWFGVNLLSIGLHSYGFIEGIAYGLIGFIALETVLIGGTYIAIRKWEGACAPA